MKTPDRLTYALDSYPPLKQAVIKAIENLSGKDRIVKIYEDIPEKFAGTSEFFDIVLKQLSIDVDISDQELQNIPQEGPVVFIANHPFGLLDGMILSKLAASVRKDWAILINSAMDKFDDFADNMLPISFEETREASRINIMTKKRALKMLNEGGAVVIFPSGGVMTSEGFFGPITGIEWKLFTAKMVQQSGATVVPVYFHGRNSRIFQVASQINFTLRAALFLHEFLNKEGKSQKVSIGKAIQPEEYAQYSKKQQLTRFLRQSVYDLGGPDVIKIRRRKDALDLLIGQSMDDIRQERKEYRKEKRGVRKERRRERLRGIFSNG